MGPPGPASSPGINGSNAITRTPVLSQSTEILAASECRYFGTSGGRYRTGLEHVNLGGGLEKRKAAGRSTRQPLVREKGASSGPEETSCLRKYQVLITHQ